MLNFVWAEWATLENLEFHFHFLSAPPAEIPGYAYENSCWLSCRPLICELLQHLSQSINWSDIHFNSLSNSEDFVCCVVALVNLSCLESSLESVDDEQVC